MDAPTSRLSIVLLLSAVLALFLALMPFNDGQLNYSGVTGIMAAVFSGGPDGAGSDGGDVTGVFNASQAGGVRAPAGVNGTEGMLNPENLSVSNRRESLLNEVTTGFFNGVAGSSAGGAAMQGSGLNNPPAQVTAPAIRLKNKNARHSFTPTGGLEIELEPDQEGASLMAMAGEPKAFVRISGLSSNLSAKLDRPKEARVKTAIFSVEENALIDSAILSLPKYGEVSAVLYCPSYDQTTSNCPFWETTAIPFAQNATHMTFNVTHFTAYAGGSPAYNSNLTLWDDADPEGGSVQRNVSEIAFFYANYTNSTSGAPIATGTCNISFAGSQNNNMSFSAGTFTYNRTFSSAGAYFYNVTCADSVYGPLNATDSILVGGQGSGAVTVYLNDTFDRADNADVGPNWAGDKSYWNVTNNNLTKVQDIYNKMVLVNDSLMPSSSTGYITEIKSGNDNGFSAIVYARNMTHFYEIRVQDDANQAIRLFRWENGATPYSNGISIQQDSWYAGDTLKIVAMENQSVFAVYQNGIYLGTLRDTNNTYTQGRAGVGYYQFYAGTQFDSFIAYKFNNQTNVVTGNSSINPDEDYVLPRNTIWRNFVITMNGSIIVPNPFEFTLDNVSLYFTGNSDLTNYLKVDGGTLVTDNSTYVAPSGGYKTKIYVLGSGKVRISNSTFDYLGNISTSGFRFAGSGGNVSEYAYANYIRNSVFHGSRSNATADCIYAVLQVQSGLNVSGNTFINTSSCSPGGTFIYIWQAVNTLIDGNTIEGNGVSRIAIYTQGTTGTNITRNRISGIWDYTLDIWGGTDREVYLANNDILNGQKPIVLNNGILGAIIENNVINLSDPARFGTIGWGSNVNNTVYRNNTYYNADDCFGGQGTAIDLPSYNNAVYGLTCTAVRDLGMAGGGKNGVFYNIDMTSGSTNKVALDLQYDTGSRNNTYTNVTTRSFGYGLNIKYASNSLFRDVNSTGTVYDIQFLGSNSNNRFINHVFNAGKIKFSDDSDVLNTYYYADVLARDSVSQPLSNITLAIVNEVNSSYPSINRNGNNKTSFMTTAGGHTPLPVGNDSTTAVLMDYWRSNTTQQNMTYSISAYDPSNIWTNVTNTIYPNGTIQQLQPLAQATNVTPDESWYRPNPNTYQNTTVLQINYTRTNLTLAVTNATNITVREYSASRINFTAVASVANQKMNVSVSNGAFLVLNSYPYLLKKDGVVQSTQIASAGRVVFANVDVGGEYTVELLNNITVSLSAPPDNQLTKNATIAFNCSASSGSPLVNITLYGSWSSNWHANQTANVGGGSNSSVFTKTITPDGSYAWNCMAFNGAGNFSFASGNYSFTIDTIPPAAVAELANQSQWDSWIFWNWTNPLSDFNYSMVYLNGTWRQNTSLNYYNATGLTASTWYLLSVRTVDRAGNVNVSWVNSSAMTLGDMTPPAITVIRPENRSYGFNESLPLNFSLSESASWCGYSLDGGANVTVSSCLNATFSVSGSGLHGMQVFANDSSGNMGSSTRYFTVDMVKPRISFVPPTLPNGNTTAHSWVYANVSAIDSESPDKLAAFIDWNRSLVLWLRFDNSSGAFVQDFSGWNNTAFLVNMKVGLDNGSSGLTTSGMHGNAVLFDEIDDVVNITASPLFDFMGSDSFTIEFFVRTQTVCGGTDVIFARKGVTGSWPDIWIGCSPSDRKLTFSAGDSNANQVLIKGQNISDNLWHHVAAEYDGAGGMTYLFVDGVVVNQSAASFTGNFSYPSGINPCIGAYRCSVDGSAYRFPGVVDDVRVWRRALSSDEINAAYNAGAYRLHRNFTGLVSGNYSYVAYAEDLAGNWNATETMWVFVNVSDLDAPVLSGISASVSSASAAIAWDSDEPANSTVFYGTTVNTGLSAGDSAFATVHSVFLSGLSASTLYYYNVSSCDVAGNCAVSLQFNFTTSAAQVQEAPSGAASSGGGGSAVVAATRSITITPQEPLTRIIVNIKTALSGPSLSVVNLRTAPAAAPSSVVYQYFNISRAGFNDSDVLNATVEFRVNRSWITGNSISSVYLARYSKGWVNLRTELVNSTGLHNTYRAYANGFSYFAVVGVASSPSEPVGADLDVVNVSGLAVNGSPAAVSNETLAPPIVPVVQGDVDSAFEYLSVVSSRVPASVVERARLMLSEAQYALDSGELVRARRLLDDARSLLGQVKYSGVVVAVEKSELYFVVELLLLILIGGYVYSGWKRGFLLHRTAAPMHGLGRFLARQALEPPEWVLNKASRRMPAVKKFVG